MRKGICFEGEPVKRIKFFAIAFVIIFGLLAWSPWIHETYAKERAVTEFELAWLNVADGCGFYCHGCGAIKVKQIAFGKRVTLEFACGMLSADTPDSHQQADVDVSFIGKVYGLPRP